MKKKYIGKRSIENPHRCLIELFYLYLSFMCTNCRSLRVVYFLFPSSMQVRYSTHPAEESTRWKQTSFFFGEGLCVSRGEEIEGIFALNLLSRKKIAFEIEVHFEGEVAQIEKTFSYVLWGCKENLLFLLSTSLAFCHFLCQRSCSGFLINELRLSSRFWLAT